MLFCVPQMLNLPPNDSSTYIMFVQVPLQRGTLYHHFCASQTFLQVLQPYEVFPLPLWPAYMQISLKIFLFFQIMFWLPEFPFTAISGLHNGQQAGSVLQSLHSPPLLRRHHLTSFSDPHSAALRHSWLFRGSPIFRVAGNLLSSECQEVTTPNGYQGLMR